MKHQTNITERNGHHGGGRKRAGKMVGRDVMTEKKSCDKELGRMGSWGAGENGQCEQWLVTQPLFTNTGIKICFRGVVAMAQSATPSSVSFHQ